MVQYDAPLRYQRFGGGTLLKGKGVKRKSERKNK